MLDLLAIDRLRRFGDAARAGEPVEPADMRWIGEAIARALADRIPLDAALGLKPAPGQRSATTLAALSERDELIRAAAAHFYPDAGPTEAARRLATAIARYEASAWVRERTAPECPPRHHGRVEAVAWRILRLREPAPSERTIRRIISADAGHELPPIRGHGDQGPLRIDHETPAKDRDV